MNTWKILDRTRVFERKIYYIEDLLCRHPDLAAAHHFTIMHTPDWINVIALTPKQELILVRQHRLGTDELTLETPAGVLEPGEDPMAGALRELREETGCEPEQMQHLVTLKANPAIMDTRVHFFLATGCHPRHNQDLDPTEDIELEYMHESEIPQAIASGRIDHALIVTALLLYLNSKDIVQA